MRFSRSIALVLLISACSTPSIEKRYEFRTFEEDGIQVVETVGGPRYKDPIFEYSELLDLYQDPAIEASLLYRPGNFTMDEEGLFFVCDYGNTCIVMFDRTGRYIRHFGREGSGPGEFSSMGSMFVHAGLINVYDLNNRRTTRFRKDGTLLDIVSIPGGIADMRFGMIRQMYVLQDGNMALVHILSDQKGSANFTQFRLVLLSTSNDTLWTVNTPLIRTGIHTQMETGGYLNYPFPFASIPAIWYSPNRGFLISSGAEPELTWYGEDGAVLSRIRIDLEPKYVTAEDRSKYRARLQERLAEAEGRMVQMYEAELKSLEFPETMAHWRDVIVDNSGYIWLMVPEHTVDREAMGGDYLYRVVSPEGEYLGDTRVPHVRTFRVCQGKLMANWTPEDAEEPRLTVFEIRSLMPGFQYP